MRNCVESVYILSSSACLYIVCIINNGNGLFISLSKCIVLIYSSMHMLINLINESVILIGSTRMFLWFISVCRALYDEG